MSKKTKKFLTALLCVVLSVATIGLAVKVSKLQKTKELGAAAYSVGTLNVEDGKEAKSDYALRTGYQEAVKFDKIVIGKDAKITYQVFYFDADKNFIGKSEALAVDMEELPTTQTVGSDKKDVKYYRVVILVPETETKVSLLNKGDYAKQLTVTIKK